MNDTPPAENQQHPKRQRKRDRLEPREVVVKGRILWQVNLGSEIREGKRIRLRKTFASKDRARTYASLKRIERTNHGTAGISLSDRLRGEAIEAAKLLEPYHASLLDAVREYIGRRELMTKSETVANALKSFLGAKRSDNLSLRYLEDLKSRLGRFCESFGERKVADIESGELYAWLQDLGQSPISRNTFHLRLNVFFEYCRIRGWLLSNPVSAVPRAKVPQGGVVGILSVPQVAKLLENASVDTLPYWAIGVFCGLRSAELARLAWEDLHWDETLLEVPSLKSKTASRRFVRLRPNLLAWLDPYRGRQGIICPSDFRQRILEDRRRAGITTWPHNGLRHSFASYHLAHFRDPRELALEMGHINSEITFRCYRELVRPSEAERFWKIVPALESSRAVVRRLEVA
jgi:integrase